ncbi:hypothetical protein VTG60DRAFT_689 [Thermothelomyces hinnuleus]
MQTNPGMQQPPPRLLPQAVLPSAQSEMPPLQVAPEGQQPTGPSPVSGTSTQVSSWPQQLLGNPIEEQLLVPLGQAHWRFSRRARADAARRKRLHAGAMLSSFSGISGSERRANGGRRESSADALAQRRRASSASCKLRAAIAAAVAAWGLLDAGAKVVWSPKAQYSWWNLAPRSAGIFRIAVGNTKGW